MSKDYKAAMIKVLMLTAVMAAVLLSALMPVYLAIGQELRLAQLDTAPQEAQLQELKQQLEQLTQQRDARTQTLMGLTLQVRGMQHGIERAYQQSGMSAMMGEGIIITLDDASPQDLAQYGAAANPNWFLVHDGDLVRVVAALRAAGAQAVAINKRRLSATTRIRCTGPAILVGDDTFAPPFTIQAMGNAQQLMQALHGQMEGDGIWKELSVYGINFTMQPTSGLILQPILPSKINLVRIGVQNLKD